ncbi:hypothetical protein ACFPAF_08845 [Hymenobacter endophyticus]|uniref:Bacterial surface antigen (D15) domain-containing protein n=1 Tax=Hymenobacter endophyticus TaxID=3076335 RepID=A0ABU3TGJ2_9BACT|nr:hypothetical protein [Hymenobacter endophyticus]MDU0370496.1 hypothetical protein [Hymenobacter endophyticus]
MKYLFWLSGLLLSWACATTAAAQTPAMPLPDTTRLSKIRPDSLRRRFDQERLLNGLKAYTKRKTIAGKAASALFNFTERREDRAGLDATLLDRQFDRHNYKVVRRISIRTLDAFGFSISDTTRVPRNILEKAGNTLHIKTTKARVRQVLLFREGEELEPQALAESERLLRQTSELLDARVYVNERTTTADSVDIQVVTKDIFSISGSLAIRDVQAGVIGLRDVNFLGQGHQFRNRLEYGRRDDGPQAQSWRYNGTYLVPFRNFLYGQARYFNQTRTREAGVRFNRDFYSINTRYAGAISYDYFDRLVAIDGNGSEEFPYIFKSLRYNTQDAWLGRALRLKSYDLAYENPGRMIVSGRVIRTNFSRKPTPDYESANLVLGTVGYSVRRYYKDKYLFGFGRTEDIPTGTLASLTAGYEFNEVADRRYLGVRLAYAGYHPQRGYLYLNGEFGSFVRRRDGAWQQGLLNGELLYFTRLYHTGNYQWRHFLWQRNSIGLNRRPGEQPLTIDGERGLRGFQPEGLLTGTSRVTLNYEVTMFTPVSFLGFRMAALAFADVAWLNARTLNRTLPFSEAPYSGFGLGLRFRNEYAALRTFQITFGFYPRGMTSPNGIRIFENSRAYYDFSDFSFGQPGIVRYQ